MTETSSSGYGQQTPFDTTNEHNAIAFLVRQIVAQMDTAKLVKVIAVHPGEAADGRPPAGGTVDVQPLVSQVDGGGFATPHGTVFGIPFSRAQGAGGGVVCDPKVGDVGQVVACDRDISAAKKNKAPSTPGSRRTFDVADGVYVGAVLPSAPTQALWFKADGVTLFDANGNSVVLDGDGVLLTDKSGNVVRTTSQGISLEPRTGGKVTVVGELVVQQGLALGGNITAADGSTYAGDIITAGAVVAGFGHGDQVGLQTHRHAGVTTGSGQTTDPVAGT